MYVTDLSRARPHPRIGGGGLRFLLCRSHARRSDRAALLRRARHLWPLRAGVQGRAVRSGWQRRHPYVHYARDRHGRDEFAARPPLCPPRNLGYHLCSGGVITLTCRFRGRCCPNLAPFSYIHLTLPTNREGDFLMVRFSFKN